MPTNTALHVRGKAPDEIERALEAIFTRHVRARRLRLEGTYSAVLARLTSEDLVAGYRYLLLRPPHYSGWTPLLELGNRADGLDVALSQTLDGAAVFTAYVYGDVVSGYRLARDGELVDRYESSPSIFAGESELPTLDLETLRGRPERFADLLPRGTTPEDFARIVLRPGWWEAREGVSQPTGASDKEDIDSVGDVDEADRMRCIGLALELWEPTTYPFAEELEDLPDRLVGPAIALAFD